MIAFDRDKDADQNSIRDSRFTLIRQDFKFIENILTERGIQTVDGIIADLGVSSHQFDTAQRGFSFRFDAPLDMRMDQRQELTAEIVLNEAPETELRIIFQDFGEVPNARKLARTVVAAREQARIVNTTQFESLIRDCIPRDRKSKYLAQVYQALRIEVNGEMEALARLLEASLRMLSLGGRMVVIAYHSLEDRMVKRFSEPANLANRLEKDFYGNSLCP